MAASNQHTSVMVSFHTSVLNTQRAQRTNTKNLLLGADYAIRIPQFTIHIQIYKTSTLKKRDFTSTTFMSQSNVMIKYEVEILILIKMHICLVPE